MKYIVFFLGLIFFGVFLVSAPLLITAYCGMGYAIFYLILFLPIGLFTGAFIADEIQINS